MKHLPLALLFACNAAALGGCCANGPPPARSTTEEAPMPAATAPAERSPKSQRFTGTLRGGIMAAGAETTGWMLERPDGTRVDVDVSKAADAAAKLDGKPVVIDGGMTTANWVERGEKPLLIADRIEPGGAGR